jgi:hypothetical protein
MIIFRYKDADGDTLALHEQPKYAKRVLMGTGEDGVYITAEKAPEIAQALLEISGASALVVELPETTFEGNTIKCQGLIRSINRTDDIYSGEYERTALKMLAVARRVKAERNKLADSLKERRKAVLTEMGSTSKYEVLSGPLKKAVDKIIELQDQAEGK